VELPIASETDMGASGPGNASHILDKSLQLNGRILYIEDNLSNLKLIEMLVDSWPEVHLMAAMQGTLGIELAASHHPDLILLDLHLPDMSGSDVLACLKSDPITSKIPVVVISADATAGQIRRLRQAGAYDYLTKPLDLDRFIQTLTSLLTDDN
jgi:CheY-like chemotaxis protein